ncbi:hypothetical protein MTO96_015649 [Rhipicephalus appendiculatus]
MASPPWSYWRDRKADNGMPRILLWHRDAAPSRDAKERWPSSSSSVAYCPLHAPGDPDDRRNKSAPKTCRRVGRGSKTGSSGPGTTSRPWGGSGQYPENLWDVHKCGRTHPKVPETEFDWTMGRRKDSDVRTPYKAWRCGDDVVAAASANKTMTVADVARRNREVLGYYGARRDAVWIVGHCEWHMCQKSSVDVVELTKALGADAGSEGRPQNVSVDLITDCGRSTCGSRRECLRKMAAHYRFVVVTTDSDCFHSPYELIHDAFEFDIVPVILAPHGETVNYPGLSVVHSVEFSGLGNMIAHLRFLLSSPEAYEKYLSWKERCVEVAADDLCQLCVALNDKFYEGRVERSPGDRSTVRRTPAKCDDCHERAPAFAWAFPVSIDNGPHWL